MVNELVSASAARHDNSEFLISFMYLKLFASIKSLNDAFLPCKIFIVENWGNEENGFLSKFNSPQFFPMT